MINRRRLPVLAALALGAVLPATAQAAPDWLAPTPLADGAASFEGGFGPPGLLTTGDVKVLQLPSPGVPPITRATIARSAAGDPPVNELVVDSQQGPARHPVEIHLATAPSGAAVACIDDLLGNATPFGGGRRVYYRAAGSTAWEAGPALADNPAGTTSSGSCEVAIGEDGTAVAGFIRPVKTDTEPLDRRFTVVVRPNGGSWTAPEVLSTLPPVSPNPRPVAGYDLAVTGDGTVLATWNERWRNIDNSGTDDDRTANLLRVRPAASGIFGASVDLDSAVGVATKDANSPSIAVNAAGAAVIAWQDSHDTGNANDFRARVTTRDSPNQPFGPVQVVPAPAATGFSGPRALGVAPDGTAYMATWAQGSPSSATDQNALYRRGPGGAWSAPALLGQLGNETFNVRMTFLGGDAFALALGAGSPSFAQATRWRSGLPAPDAFRDLVAPGTSGLGLRGLVPDHEGGLLALVSDGSVPAAPRELGIPFDGSPPRLRGLSVPAGATAGQPVGLSADFVDRWSAIAEVRWDFGDGNTGDGASPTHAWAQPGTYTVTVTGTDARGNARSGSAQVAVSAPAAPSPPADTIRPVVTIAAPACGKRRGAACTRYRTTRPAWRILKGAARDTGGSGLARVQIAVSRVQGKRVFVLRGTRFRPGTAKIAARTYLPARLRNGRWTFTIPRSWPAGRYVIRARAIDGAGNISRVVTRTRALR